MMCDQTLNSLSPIVKGLILMVSFSIIVAPVLALNPVDLSLGTTGALPWYETGMMPGSSNVTFIDIHNTGTVNGVLYIWINNVSETDRFGDGTALRNYMYFNVSHPRLASSLSLPAKLDSFPTAPMNVKYIIINPFYAGETIRLNWTWEFRETGTPQNDAQNATLKFNISFTLVNTTPPPPPPTPPIPSDGGGDGGTGDDTVPGFIIPPVIIPEQIAPVPGKQQPPEQPVEPGPPEQIEDQNVLVTADYPTGFDGLIYNADGEKTLQLDIDKAASVHADVMIYPDHIDVYQHGSPGVLFTFWGNTSDIKSRKIIKKMDSAELKTDPLTADFTMGPVSGSVHGILSALLLPAVIKNTISGNVSPGIYGQFHSVTAKNNLPLENIVYTFEVQRINLPKIGPANVTLTLPESYVNQQGGPESIYIGRISEETGEAELLTTEYIGLGQDGTMTFRGDSPNGTSIFGMLTAKATAEKQKEEPGVTIQPAQKPAITTDIGMFAWMLGIVQQNPVVLVIVIAVIVLAIAGFVFTVRNAKTGTKKRREK